MKGKRLDRGLSKISNASYYTNGNEWYIQRSEPLINKPKYLTFQRLKSSIRIGDPNLNIPFRFKG